MAKFSLAQKIGKLFGLYKNKNEDFFDELTDTLIEGDIGAKTAFEITETLEKRCKEKHLSDEADIKSELKELLLSFVKSVDLQPRKEDTTVYMFLGVNGAGKTTSAAKLARYYTNAGHSVVLAAADTYRAAAIEQLSYHGEKLGVRVVSHQHGADPSAVVFDAASAVSAKGGGLVIADTAGRLHNKENLVRELQKIDRIAAQKASDGAYKNLSCLMLRLVRTQCARRKCSTRQSVWMLQFLRSMIQQQKAASLFHWDVSLVFQSRLCVPAKNMMI